MSTVHVLNGPNLNLLGRREPAVYGHATLADLESACAGWAQDLGLQLDFRQTQHEGELVDWLHEVGTEVPMVEVHLSNVHAREEFRHHSYLSPVAKGVIVGLGPRGYELAIRALAAREEES